MTSEQLTKHIADMMIGGEWHGGLSAKALCKEHGFTYETVRRTAREVGKALTLVAATDLPDLVTEQMARLDLVFKLAVERIAVSMAGNEYASPDLKAAIGAVELKAKLAGALNVGARPPKEQPETFEKMSPAEQAATLRAAADEIEKAEKGARH